MVLKILPAIGATETIEIEPIQIFDPRINRYWHEDNSFSGEEFRTFLKVLYSKENIRNHPEFFFPNGTPATADLEFILSNTPDDISYALCCVTGNDQYLIYAMPSTDYWQRDYFIHPYASRVPLTPEAFTSVIADIARRLDRMQSVRHWNDFCEGTYAGYVYLMMIGQQYVEDHWEGCYDRRGVLEFHDYMFSFNQPGSLPRIMQRSDDGKAHLYKLFSYRTDVIQVLGSERVSTKETPKGTKYRRNPDDPLYGIELELSCSHTIRDIINSQEFPFFICKQDSSISGFEESNYECVTLPMDYRSQRTEWGKFFAKFLDKSNNSYEGFDNTTNTNNGLHIHVSKSAFIDNHLQRFTWFIVDPLNNEFITAVSERGATLGEYARVPTFARMSRKRAYDRCVAECSAFRGAVNVGRSSAQTIEVRIFRGIVSYATLLKNLEFVDAVFWFTQQHSYSSLTLPKFLDWVEATPRSKYKALKMFLKNMDPEIVSRAGLAQRLGHLKTEKQVLEYFDKNRLPIDDVTLDYLNRKFMKKNNQAALFDIKDGKLVINRKLYGALRDYEEQLNPFTRIAA